MQCCSTTQRLLWPQITVTSLHSCLHAYMTHAENHWDQDTHTHTHLTALFPGLPRWAGTRKIKPIEILLKQDSEWQWHQLGHMQVCTSLQTDNHASTPPLRPRPMAILCRKLSGAQNTFCWLCEWNINSCDMLPYGANQKWNMRYFTSLPITDNNYHCKTRRWVLEKK